MTVQYNEFTLNVPGEAAPWSQTEYDLLKDYADKVGNKSLGPCLIGSLNLSDIGDAATARQNLGVPDEFKELIDTPSDYTGHGSKILAVKATEDGIEFVLNSAIDHGFLSGLADDDHTQYHNNARGDARYLYKENTSPFTPDADYEPATKKYVDETISSMVLGLDWQDSVLDRYDPTSGLPSSPNSGDRYISTATANGWTIHNIYEYDGSSWDETVTNEGFAAWVEDEDVIYTFNGTIWVKFGSTVDHGNLIGLADDDHTQYHNNTRGDTRYLYKENTSPFTPDADYEPATKKYVDDTVSAGTFLALTDTISAFTANRILYESDSAVIDNTNFTFDGTNLSIPGKLLRAGVSDDYIYLENDKITIHAGGTDTMIFKDDKVYSGLYKYGYGTNEPMLNVGSASGDFPLVNGIHVKADVGSDRAAGLVLHGKGTGTGNPSSRIIFGDDAGGTNQKLMEIWYGYGDQILINALNDDTSLRGGSSVCSFANDGIALRRNTIIGNNIVLSSGKSTIEDWSSTYQVFQLGGNASFYADVSEGSNKHLYISQNVYNDGTNKRISSGNATRYTQRDGIHEFFIGSDFYEDPDDPITFHSRLKMTSIGVIVNDDKENLNFQIKGASNNNLVLVDTYNEKIGIGKPPTLSELLDVNGSINTNNGNLYSGQAEIDDDDVLSFTPDKPDGILVIYCQDTADAAIYSYSTHTTAHCNIIAHYSEYWGAYTGVLNGTTGLDNSFNVSAHTDGKIYLENRWGST